jgi:hypothetical protein
MKYGPVESYLSRSVQSITVLEFAEIERIIGSRSLNSARSTVEQSRRRPC